MAETELELWWRKEFDRLHRAYKGGCLGALYDVCYKCQRDKVNYPPWAFQELGRLLRAVIADDEEGKTLVNNYRSWYKRYKKDLADLELYEAVLDAREHGAEWSDVYDIASTMVKNQISEKHTEAVKKAYQRVKKRLETEPYRYFLLTSIRQPFGKPTTEQSLEAWDWIFQTIKSGNPKGVDSI